MKLAAAFRLLAVPLGGQPAEARADNPIVQTIRPDDQPGLERLLSTDQTGATVTNASWNGALPAGASTTFGFLATGTPGASDLSCTASGNLP
ncbi:cellulose binding domain-containing protein [Actinoplanes subtropicus]|uniref:cellulose binding domain-containing protein n=1 Tax=Actinoplanes subtropicus TaxID=543632 RepID=UPI0004C44054|nr:cellulose binding domain-containing protein [Actinoplanes subtropicus]